MKSRVLPHPPINLSSMLEIASDQVASLGGKAAATRHYGVSKTALYGALRGESKHYKLLERIVTDAVGPVERYDMWRIGSEAS